MAHTSALSRPPQPYVPPQVVSQDQESPVLNAAFLCGTAMLFLRFSNIHQVITYYLHINTYLLYIVGIPALVGVAIAGGLTRALKYRPAVFWALYGIWLMMAVPFSTWKGGSASFILSYWRTNLLLVFIVGGLAIDWKKTRLVIVAIGIGAIVTVLSSRIFSRLDANDRFQLDFGTIANSNDFAAHLILVLPFLIWFVMTKKSLVIRIVCMLCFLYGIYVVLSTASRGAAVALVVQFLFFLFTANARQRLAVLLLVPASLAVFLTFLPQRTLQRIKSFSSSDSEASEEALQSSEARQYLLRTSLYYTFRYPLFGVGPGQFSTFEGNESRAKGEMGNWHDTHNSFTQVSSECGIPALIFYVGGIISTFTLLKKANSLCRDNPNCRELNVGIYCTRLALVGYIAASTFVNFAYTFYLPSMAGLAIGLFVAAQKFASQPLPAAQPVPFPYPPPRPVRPRGLTRV